MSVCKRKISHWSIEFRSDDTLYFDGQLFSDFLRYINGLSDIDRLYRDEKANKAIVLDSIREEVKGNKVFFSIIIKSCKFNHSPNYLSSEDGSERRTNKELHEGDKEITHICMRIDESEAYMIFEERKSAVTVGGVIKYFNRLLPDFLAQAGYKSGVYLFASIIPPEDFLKSLGQANRISSAEIFIEREVLGSQYLNLMDIDANTKEEIIVTVKSIPRESLAKKAMKDLFLSIATEGTKVRRIRLRGKDINKMDVTIDSLNGKLIEEITVDLTPMGIVDSGSILPKLQEMLCKKV